jgi:serine/threonine protein kinase
MLDINILLVISMIGKTLDKRYKIIRQLGSGGFGEAFLAKDISLHGIFCVVKQLKPIDKSEQVLKIARRLFVTESETLLRLGKHDQIPTLLAHLEKEKDFFLVQEFVDGHPLSAEIRVNKPLAVDNVVDLLASALEPLAFAHANNVIHRDIKPDNLMRRHSDGKVVLIDFGAVKEVINSSNIAQGQAVFTVCIGTPGYMPVEQANGKPKFSSDIYALGITCIQALTGLSEQELDPISWRHLINVDTSLADILDRMVHSNFNHRYTSGSEALEAVQEYVKEKPRVSAKVPYSPPPELVNNYSYVSTTISTRKVLVVTRVSTALGLPETLVSKVFLWLESSFCYTIIAFMLSVNLQVFLSFSALVTCIDQVRYGLNPFIVFIISIIFSLALDFEYMIKNRVAYLQDLFILLKGEITPFVLISFFIGYYILDHNRIDAFIFLKLGFYAICLFLVYLEISNSLPFGYLRKYSAYHSGKVNAFIYYPAKTLAVLAPIFLGLGFLSRSRDIFNSGFELYISVFISCIVMIGSHGIVMSILHAIAIDTNVGRKK